MGITSLLLVLVATLAVLLGCVYLPERSATPTAPEEASQELLWAGNAWNVSVSPDGSYVVVEDGAGILLSFDREGNPLWHHNEGEFGLDYRFGPVAVSSDGSYIATGACLFNREGQFLWGIERRPDLVGGTPSLSSDGSYMAVGWSGSSTSEGLPGTVSKYVYLYDRDGRLLWAYETDGGVGSVAVSSDGSYIAAGSFDNNTYFFNREGRLLWSYRSGGPVYSVSVSSDGSYIAAGSYDLSTYAGNTYFFHRDGRLLWNYETDFAVGSVLVSSDGSYVAAKSNSGYLYFFNREGKLLWRQGEVRWLWKKGGNLDSISISPDASYIAAGGRDGKLFLYNRKGELILKYEAGSRPIESISISSDGAYIAAVSRDDGKAYLFRRSSN